MKLPAPAKVNLHLRILGRRSDGFHDLETLIVPVSLADEISVERTTSGDITVRCDDPEVPDGDGNLVVRAVQEFSLFTGQECSVRIGIRKRIPLGAGLGGGSSDAAATLLGLDAVFGTNLGTAILRELAARLGSDVPFFINPQPAWCRGRGEIIEPLSVPESLSLLLIKPPFGVGTPWAYQNWSASGPEPEAQDLGWVKLLNSLEPPVFEKYLVLPAMKSWLREQVEVRAVAMSGSGSTMFAVLRTGEDGVALEARAKAEFGATFWTALCATGR